jgi:hypothetical protein
MTPHLKRVGEIASLWALLEFHLDMLIWSLLQAEQQPAACVTSQLSGTGSRLRAIKALIDLYDGDKSLRQALNKPSHNEGKSLRQAFNKFSSNVDAVQIKRNRIVHDTFSPSLKSKRVFQMRAVIRDNKLTFGYTQIRVAELDRTSSQIRRLLKQLYRFATKIPNAFDLLPSPHKPGKGQFARIETSRLPRLRRGKAAKRRQVPPPASQA